MLPVVRKRRVFKLKDKPIDENTLGVILDRRARRAQVRMNTGTGFPD